MGLGELIEKINAGDVFLDKRENNPNSRSYREIGQSLGRRLAMYAYAYSIPLESVFVSVGGDCRIKTPDFKQEFIQGVVSTKVSILDFGYNRSTPSVEFGGREYGTQAVAVITASHQGPEVNGLKITIKEPAKTASEVKSLKEYKLRTFHAENALNDLYKDSLRHVAGSLKGISIAVDCMNGAASGLFCDILKEKGARVHDHRNFIDGRFPDAYHNEPDPTKYENLERLQEIVKSKDANLGVAFDGDADRLVVLEENGKIVPPEYLGLVFAKHLAMMRYSGPVVLEKKLMFVSNAITNMGLKPIYVETGRPNLINKVQETGAWLGYELSGHIFTNTWLDDGMKNALLLSSMIKRTGKSVSSLVDEACSGMPYNVGELRFDFDKDKARQVMGILGKDRIDGFRYDVGKDLTISDGQCTIYLRTSSNEDKVTAVPFGPDKEDVHAFMAKVLAKVPEDLTAFSRALSECYAKTMASKHSLFYVPNTMEG